MNLRKFYPLLLVAVGLVVYHNSLFGPFVFDDLDAIVKNPDVHQVWRLQRVLFGSGHTPLEGRPVSSFAFAFQYAFSRLDVVGYHVVNVCLHLMVGVLLWEILRRTLHTTPLCEKFGTAASEVALVIALLWLVHPLNTECVTYIVQRTELLVGLAWMLMFYSLLRSADTSRPIGWYALAIVSCLLGMGSKEVMVTAPLLAFLYDRSFLAGSFREAWRLRRPLYVGLAATWIFLLFLDAPDVSGHASKGKVLWSAVTSFFSSGDHPHSSFFDSQFSVWDTPRTESGVLLYYLRLWFWPSPQVIDYYDWPVVKLWSQAWVSMSIVAGMLCAVVWGVRHRPVWGFLGAWYFLILAPTSSIIPLHQEFVAERRLYLPMIALFCAAIGLAKVGFDFLATKNHLTPVRKNGIVCLLVVCLVILLGICTLRRNEDYRSAVSLWAETAAQRPLSARAHSNLASALGQLGENEPAVLHFREAVRLNPRFSPAQYGLGVALAKQGKFDEAIAQYQLALLQNPRSDEVHNSLGIVLAKQGRVEEAVAEFREALRLNPTNEDVKINLEHVLSQKNPIHGPIIP